MKAVIYARFSSDNQREESIDAQVRACREYCARQGFDVVEVFADQALTGTTDDRPEFLRMIYEAPKAKWGVIVVHKLDRFARNKYDSAIYKRKLKQLGIRVRSATEYLDDSPQSIMMETMLEGMAEYFSANLSVEVKKGLRENAFQKKTTGGFPPLGYDFDEDGHFVVNEQEAALVRMIFGWARDGVSYKRMCEILASIGAKTKIGNDFRNNSIHDILRNEKYMGTLVYNRFRRGLDGKVKRHALGGNDDSIVHEDGIPALVPEPEWTAVNKAMDDRRRVDRTKAGERYLLVGRIFCGLCGLPMCGKAARQIRYYYCSSYDKKKPCGNSMVACKKIDPLVLQAIEEKILNPEAIDALIPSVRRQAENEVIQAASDHETIRERLAALEQEIKRVVDAIAEIGISTALKNKLRTLEEEKKEALLAMADAETDVRKFSVDLDGLRSMLERDMAALHFGEPEELRRLVLLYVDRVEVMPPPPGKRYGRVYDVSLRIQQPTSTDAAGGPPGNMRNEFTPLGVPKGLQVERLEVLFFSLDPVFYPF